MLPIHISKSASTTQDGSSQEFVTANAGKVCHMQNARCRGLWEENGGQKMFKYTFFSK